ncbi:MAG: S1 RNA-binding domain-containing protein [Chloroflexota bacterium]|nr:S1 RNA-binding domain-containing protein [Chloroflexota bacterium]
MDQEGNSTQQEMNDQEKGLTEEERTEEHVEETLQATEEQEAAAEPVQEEAIAQEAPEKEQALEQEGQAGTSQAVAEEAAPPAKAAQERLPEGESFADLLEEEYDYTQMRRNEVYEATILAIGDNDIVVDMGTKRDGIIPPKDLSFVDEELVKRLKVGDRIPVAVMKTWGEEDGILVSLNKGLQQEDWLRAEEMLETGEVMECEVEDYNRGGVLVSFGRLRGFVPNSHLTSIPTGLRGEELRERKADLVGTKMRLAVIEVNQRRRRLVLSRRAAQRRQRQELLEQLEEGQVRTGVVRNLVDFGAFVDLGGVDGLVHISELAHRHVTDPAEELSLGEEVEVYVLSVDRERERIALSRKKLLPDPWDSVVEEIEEGDVIQGTVTSIVGFGAFVRIHEGFEGLVHVSEMPYGEASLSTLEPDTEVTVRVLNINHEKQQIGLSMRDIEEEPEAKETEAEQGEIEEAEAAEGGEQEEKTEEAEEAEALEEAAEPEEEADKDRDWSDVGDLDQEILSHIRED